MKNITGLIIVILCISGCLAKAQLATTDPGVMAQNSVIIGQNGQMLGAAIAEFKQLQQVYQQGKQSYSEFVQIKDFIQTSEQRLKTIGDIKDLKLNDINIILDKVFCVKQSNYFPTSVKFLSVVNKIKAGFSNCNNQQVYDNTFSGILDQFEDNLDKAYEEGSKEVNTKLNQLNSSLHGAETAGWAMNSYNTRMKLELGLKYKAISDQLMQLSEELHLAINEDQGSAKNIKLTPADRMKMMDLANQYQMQALEYEQKSAELLKQSSEMNSDQQKQLARVKRDLSVSQMINFNL